LSNHPLLSDREFWIIVRRALLMICDAIEKKYIKNSDTTTCGVQVHVEYNPPTLPSAE